MKITRKQIKQMIMEKLNLSEGSGRAAPVGSPDWRQRDQAGHSASQKPRSERAEEFLYHVGIDVQTNSWKKAKEASIDLQRPILDAVGNPAEEPIEESSKDSWPKRFKKKLGISTEPDFYETALDAMDAEEKEEEGKEGKEKTNENTQRIIQITKEELEKILSEEIKETVKEGEASPESSFRDPTNYMNIIKSDMASALLDGTFQRREKEFRKKLIGKGHHPEMLLNYFKGLSERELEKFLKPLEEEKDEKWIQGAEEDIEKRGTEGVCTGEKFGSKSCRPESKRYNLAKTFKKMDKKRKD